jgi:pimeloyl-ACP methyl ester carboxylesterase
MGIITVPGAQLYFERQGSGPLIVMIPGANGTADPFRGLAADLARRYTVVTYDRRGFSRSVLDGPQDYDRRLETDAEDVRSLIEHTADGPAIVFGTSSGALVALALLAGNPSAVHVLVVHEPPTMRLLPEGGEWLRFFLECYETYRESGIDAALEKFRERTFSDSDRQAMARMPRNERTLANAAYWFEHELRQYPAFEPDIDLLRTYADRILLLAGRESRGHPTHEVNAEIARRLGRELIEVPGGHIGFATEAAEFAQEFVRALERFEGLS